MVNAIETGPSDRQSHIMLFNDSRYQRCNLAPGERLFRYDHIAEGRFVGTLSGVVVDGGLLDCGHSAPFGGIDLVRRTESVGVVFGLLRAAINTARGDGVRQIRIRARPGYFGSNEAASELALLQSGAGIERSELSLGIDLAHYRAAEDYIAALRSLGRNRLLHGLAAAADFGPAKDSAHWVACYELLGQTKRRRGAEMRFSLEYLMRLRKLFGDRIAMYRLALGGELVAAALVYRVRPEWDCLIAWGDDLRHRDRQVMNVMAFHLIRTAVAEGVRLLDLGISSVDGVPDDGLIRFKRSIGATTGLRLDFRLSL